MAKESFGSMEEGSAYNAPAPVHASPATLGHYRTHIENNKSAGVKHLGDTSASNATHSLLSRASGMPAVPSALPSPNMSTTMPKPVSGF
jgi:hypothetical protein